MANGITEDGARIQQLTAQVVTPDGSGFYNGTRVQAVAEFDWSTGAPVSAGSGSANGTTTDGRRIQAVVLTEVTPDGNGFYVGTRVQFVELFDWHTGEAPSGGGGTAGQPIGLLLALTKAT